MEPDSTDTPERATDAIRRGEFDHWGEVHAGRFECGVCAETRRNLDTPRRRFRGHLSGEHLDMVIDAMGDDT